MNLLSLIQAVLYVIGGALIYVFGYQLGHAEGELEALKERIAEEEK